MRGKGMFSLLAAPAFLVLLLFIAGDAISSQEQSMLALLCCILPGLSCED